MCVCIYIRVCVYIYIYYIWLLDVFIRWLLVCFWILAIVNSVMPIGDRGWDGRMASLTQWTWVWVNSGSWWWTGRPGILRFIGSQRVGHNWATELNWKAPEWLKYTFVFLSWFPTPSFYMKTSHFSSLNRKLSRFGSFIYQCKFWHESYQGVVLTQKVWHKEWHS